MAEKQRKMASYHGYTKAMTSYKGEGSDAGGGEVIVGMNNNNNNNNNDNNGPLGLSFIEEARTLALAWYSSQPDPARARAAEAFRSMDGDGNGRVTADELRSFAAAASLPAAADSLLFALDSDRSGSLSFEECITLFYLLTVRGVRRCSSCSAALLRVSFTCSACWRQSGVSATPAAAAAQGFYLCQSCFFSRAFRHPHDDAFLDDYQMFNLMLYSATPPPPTVPQEQVECRVCKESHYQKSPSYLLKEGGHVIKDTIKANSFICEWCLCWQCSKCGVFFKGQICSARLSQWLEKSRFCNRCGGQKKVEVDIRRLLQEVEYKHGSNSCDACNMKIRNGLMLPMEIVEYSTDDDVLFPQGFKNGNNVQAMRMIASGLKSIQMGGKMLKKDICSIM